jgi:hypothetical protein
MSIDTHVNVLELYVVNLIRYISINPAYVCGASMMYADVSRLTAGRL